MFAGPDTPFDCYNVCASDMPALLLESHARMPEINDGGGSARVAHKRAGNKLECVCDKSRRFNRPLSLTVISLSIYQLLCSLDYNTRPPLSPQLRTREKLSSLPPTPPRQASADPVASSSRIHSTSGSATPDMTRPAAQQQPPAQHEKNSQEPPLEWDWDIEHEDRKAEARADAALLHAMPFQVDRKLLKDIVHERMGAEVARIKFLGAGASHSIESLLDFSLTLSLQVHSIR